MTWLSCIKLLLTLASALVAYSQEKKAIDAAAAVSLSARLKGALDDIKAAEEARDRVDDFMRKHPGWMPGDDPNRRD